VRIFSVSAGPRNVSSGHCLGRNGADGDEQYVVRDIADRGLRLVAGGVDALERTERESRAGGGSECVQLVEAGLPQPERLGNRERPVPEVWLRPHKLDLDAFLGERAQCQRGLQRCDTPAGDNDPCRHHDLLEEAA
jgi:hypothetical protein